MLKLNLGINLLYVTVSELNTINNARYNIIIHDETTHTEKNVTILDTSVNPIRYNKYELTLVDDILNEDLINGIVYLNVGNHTYTITATTASIVPIQKTIVCEIGISKVEKNSFPPGTIYTDGKPEQKYISYTGNINQQI